MGTSQTRYPSVGLDLKKEILEKKNISGSLDFDLKITDDSGKGMSTIKCLTIPDHPPPPPSELYSYIVVVVCKDVRSICCSLL